MDKYISKKERVRSYSREYYQRHRDHMLEQSKLNYLIANSKKTDFFCKPNFNFSKKNQISKTSLSPFPPLPPAMPREIITIQAGQCGYALP